MAELYRKREADGARSYNQHWCPDRLLVAHVDRVLKEIAVRTSMLALQVWCTIAGFTTAGFTTARAMLGPPKRSRQMAN